MNNFLVHTPETRKEMLKSIGLESVEDLFKQIPEKANYKDFKMENPISEMEAQKKVRALAKKNSSEYVSFLGGGVYNKYIPAVVSDVARRWEFLTAYTPYQPEISQGTLQVMYEFQTMMCRLTGMDISNATVYDGANACAEACLMAVRISKKDKVLVSKKLNPDYLQVVKTYCWAGDIQVEEFEDIPSNTSDYACVLVQNPDYYGEISEIKPVDCLLIICCDVSTLSILKTPAQCGADIVVGDVQSLGIPMNFGGPHAGFIACREKYMRQMPGRLAGQTLDKDGKTAYTLTIQTREQHIKREKATSNICSNQALIGLCANVYLSAVGEDGFKQAGFLSTKYAHLLADKLAKKGVKILSKNFFNEFTYEVDDAEKVLNKLKENNILGGIKLDSKRILVSTTEMNSIDEINLYAELF
ncbi:MAG: aminomethyl-transferring glycine dehydrogenase subunit GcvPA [Clostridiaceae bacterium]|jgi:glycine dehydrogenase subunit 1|nr:aminomethyl-transferring glycine dehydrogenase subunit GcvPA [Clostridiaceae bacterium]